MTSKILLAVVALLYLTAIGGVFGRMAVAQEQPTFRLPGLYE